MDRSEWEKSGKLHKEIATFDGGYSYTGAIVISDRDNYDNNACDICKVLYEPRQPMLLIDGSDGEYRAGKVCMKCLNKIVKEYYKDEDGR